jgi:plastocyanin
LTKKDRAVIGAHDIRKEQPMIRNLEAHRSWADTGWLAAAAAMFSVFVGMMFMLFFGQTIAARADDAGATVGIDKFLFGPAALTVKPGTTVTFENRDGMAHNVVGVGGLFRSKALDTNDKFSFTFDKPGEYAYFCGLHPFMKGKVIVAP